MGHPVSNSWRPQPQPQPKPTPDEDHGDKKQPKPVPNEDHGDKKYDGNGPVRKEYEQNDGTNDASNTGNGPGKEGFDKYQENIDNLRRGPDGSFTEPGDKKDRVDGKGHVYTWDPDANGGKGAWGAAGKLSAEDAVNVAKGEDVSDNVQWYDDESYDKASGLSYDEGSDGYDPEADKV